MLPPIDELFNNKEQVKLPPIEDLFKDGSRKKELPPIDELFTKEPSIMEKAGDLYTRQAASGREIMRSVFSGKDISTGAVQGFQHPESSKKFQDEAIDNTNKFVTNLQKDLGIEFNNADHETAVRFIAGVPGSTLGLIADTVTNPADLALALLGEKAIKYVGKIPFGSRTLGERAMGNIKDVFKSKVALEAASKEAIPAVISATSKDIQANVTPDLFLPAPKNKGIGFEMIAPEEVAARKGALIENIANRAAAGDPLDEWMKVPSLMQQARDRLLSPEFKGKINMDKLNEILPPEPENLWKMDPDVERIFNNRMAKQKALEDQIQGEIDVKLAEFRKAHGEPTPAEIASVDAFAKAQAQKEFVSEVSSGAKSQEPIDYAGNINLGKLSTTEKAEGVIKDTANLFKDKITKQTRGVQTQEVTKRLADKLGTSAEKLAKTAKGKAFNAEQLLSSEKVLKEETNKVLELQKKIVAGANSDEDLIAFRQAVTSQNNVQKVVMGGKAESGRALQANKIIVQGERQVAAKAAIKPTGMEKESLLSLVDKATKVKTEGLGSTGGNIKPVNPEEMAAATEELRRRAVAAGAKTAEEVTAFLVKGGIPEAMAKQVASGIGALQTETGAFAQKKMSQALSANEREITEEIAKRLSQIDPDDPIAVNKFIRSIGKVKRIDQIYSVFINSILSGPQTHMVNTTGNILRSFMNPVFRTAGAVIESPKRLIGKQPDIYFGEATAEVIGRVKGFTEGFRRAGFVLKHGISEEQITKFDTRPTPIKGVVGEILGTPTKALTAEDEIFKAVNFIGETHALAYRQAAKEGLKGEAFNQRVAELINNPTEEILQLSQTAAERQTFQQKMGDWGQTILNARGKIPGLRWIAPFVKTPGNLFKEAVRTSPAGFATPTARKGGAESSMALGQAVIGSGIAAFFAVKVMEGKITGGAPRGAKERKMFYAQGKLPYSMLIGDEWISYLRIEPYATVIGLMADGYEVYKQGQLEDKEIGQISVEATKRIANLLTDKTFMNGISAAMNAIEDPERYGAKFLAGMAGGLIFPSSALRTLTRATDPLVREPQGKGFQKFKEVIMSSLPGLSQKLQAKLDIFGEPVKRQMSPWERSLTPFTRSQASSSPIIKELTRLGIEIGIPGKTQGKVALSADEYYNLRVTTGQTIKTALGNLMQRDSYKSLPDSKKTEAVEKVLKQAKEYGVKKMGFGPKKRVFFETMDKVNRMDTFEEKKQYLLKMGKEKKLPRDVLMAVAGRIK